MVPSGISFHWWEVGILGDAQEIGIKLLAFFSQGDKLVKLGVPVVCF